MIDFARQPARIQAVRGNAFTAPLRFLWRVLKMATTERWAANEHFVRISADDRHDKW